MQCWPELAVVAVWLAAIQPLLLPAEVWCWGVAGGEEEAAVGQLCSEKGCPPHVPLTGMISVRLW